MRLFELHRFHDVSGVSGIGIVAEGVQFSDGTCVIRWVTDRGSTVVWQNIEDIEAIHGHGGATRVVWIDPGSLIPDYAPLPDPAPPPDPVPQPDPARGPDASPTPGAATVSRDPSPAPEPPASIGD